jgi:acyl-[acyl-carrier-protein]-phospholipid O-acyltransferase / long-chain-fatty-acid--[acyl-carrier-protein] ligase
MTAGRRSHLPWWLEFPVGAIARLLYRIHVLGVENLPASGGAVMIANHLSYVDVIVLQLACPRPLRFLAYSGPGTHGFLEWVFRVAGVIPVSSERPREGLRLAIKAAGSGELVFLFPEGQISRTGQLMRIKRGFEVVARGAAVPVLPAAIDGLWGSIFSFSGNRYLWKSPRLKPTPVCVAFGPPLPTDGADPSAARLALMDLGAEAFAARPLLRRHVAREAVRALARRPGASAVTDRTADRRELKAAELVAATAVLARRLRSTVAEARVGIVLPPGAGAVIANLAVLAAGKVPVNLNFTASRATIEGSLRLSGVRTVVSADAMRAKLPDFPWPERTVDLRAEITAAGGRRALLPWIAAAWLLPNQWVADLMRLPRRGDGAEAALLFTSGSVGEPKGVVLTHRNLLANCAQVSSLSILPDTVVIMGCLPLFHSFGFTVTLWYPLLRPCRLVTVPSPLDTRRLIDVIHQEGVTVLLCAPTFLRPFLKKARPAELRSLDLVVTGAEKLPEDLQSSFLEAFHIDVLQGYGLTETAPASNVNQPDPPVTTATAEPQEGRRQGSVGRLVPGMTARIADLDNGLELPLTSTGMLHFRGANVFPGYLDASGGLRPAGRDGWFVTGDVGRFDEDGFLFIEGRLLRFSKIGGEMVPHGTIEQKIVEVFDLDVSEGPVVAVTGIPDTAKGETLVLLTSVDVTAAILRGKLSDAGFPNLWIPRVVVKVPAIPMLGTGKLDIAACRRLALEAK